MRKTYLALVGATLLSQPASAIIELGGDVGYFNPKQTTKSTSSSGAIATQSNGFSGALISFYGHLTFGLPNVVSFGVGPSLGFSSQTSSDYPSGVTKEEASYTRVGADFKVQAEMIPGFLPYVRVTAGRDTISWTEEGKVGTQALTFVYSTGGFYYNVLFGFQIPVGSVFALYLQAGLTGAPASTLTIKSVAVNGSNAIFTQTGTAEMSYSGFIISGGVRFSF